MLLSYNFQHELFQNKIIDLYCTNKFMWINTDNFCHYLQCFALLAINHDCLPSIYRPKEIIKFNYQQYNFQFHQKIYIWLHPGHNWIFSDSFFSFNWEKLNNRIVSNTGKINARTPSDLILDQQHFGKNFYHLNLF